MSKITISNANARFCGALAEEGARACLAAVLDSEHGKSDLRRLLKKDGASDSDIINFALRCAQDANAFGDITKAAPKKASGGKRKASAAKALPSDEDRCIGLIANGDQGSTFSPPRCKKAAEEEGCCTACFSALTKAKDASVDGKLAYHWGNLAYSEDMPCEPFVGTLPKFFGLSTDASVPPMWGQDKRGRDDCDDPEDLRKAVKHCVDKLKTGVWHDPSSENCDYLLADDSDSDSKPKKVKKVKKGKKGKKRKGKKVASHVQVSEDSDDEEEAKPVAPTPDADSDEEEVAAVAAVSETTQADDEVSSSDDEEAPSATAALTSMLARGGIDSSDDDSSSDEE